jgi:pilus assembly protein CpaE
MSVNIKVVIAKNNKDSLASMKSLIESFKGIKVIGETGDGREAITLCTNYQPDIVILDVNILSLDGFQVCVKINQMFPYIGIIIIDTNENIDTVRFAMKCGASDFLQLPLSSSKLNSSITSIYEFKQEQKKQFINSPLVMPQKKSNVISVFSSKGGVGKTVIATNVAIALHRQTRDEVLLIDLDLQFGDIADMLDIPQKISISDLINKNDIAEPQDLYKYMIPHSSGIKILPSPQLAQQADSITKDSVKNIIPLLMKVFDYIVIDLPPLFNSVTIGAIEFSDYLLLVTTMEVPTLKNIKESLEILRKLDFPEEKLILIINRYYSNSDIKVSYIKKILGIEKIFYINDAPDLVSSSINSGEPITIKYKNSEVAKQIVKISENFVDYRIVLNNKVETSRFKNLLKRMIGKNEQQK